MSVEPHSLLAAVRARDPRAIARAVSLVEDCSPAAEPLLDGLDALGEDTAMTVGITGPGGAGKSTLVQQLIGHYRGRGRRVGVIAIDPSSPLSGGALLGDRVRMMRHACDSDVVVRSMATRGRIGGVCAAAGAAVRIFAAAGCDPVIIETVGVGQAEIDIVRLADLTALVLAPGLGDDIQAMKAGLVELADVIIVNKADAPGAEALAMDMEAVAHERGRPLCRTCAADGRGIEELAHAIATTLHAAQASGALAERRQQGRKVEVLDWTLELLRPRLKNLIDAAGPARGHPRALARRLLAQLAPELATED